MSFKNNAKSPQRGHIFIPRPPYQGYEGLLGLLHLLLMPLQTLYVGVRARPCFFEAVSFFRVSFLAHPHDLIFPVRTNPPAAICLFPHSQINSQQIYLRLSIWFGAIAKSFPYFLPVMSKALIGNFIGENIIRNFCKCKVTICPV